MVGLILTGLPCLAEDRAAAGDKKITTPLYTQEGTDPAYKTLVDSGLIKPNTVMKEGVKGSTISVNKDAVERGANALNPIPKNIKLHTLCSSAIPREDFDKWTRWYQEDGHTQIFRLFKDEVNTHNERPLAARVETFSDLRYGMGDWHEWSGTYTIVRPHSCAIFQAKNPIPEINWAVQINMTESGDIILNHRRHQADVTIAKNMTGKSFDLKVRDNGRDYEVYLDGKKVGAGYYDRPKGETVFRWGMYLGEQETKHDAMIFVTGAAFK